MSRTRKDAKRGVSRERHLSVRGVRRTPPDLRKLSRAVIQLAMEQAAAEQAAMATGSDRTQDEADDSKGQADV